MLTIEGYKPLDEIGKNTHTDTQRFLRTVDNRIVILKFPSTDHPSNHEIATLENEYYLLKKLQVPDVIKPYELIESKQCPVMVLENVEGVSLNTYLKNNTLSLDQFFKIAIELTLIISKLHENNIIHKDIQPANIIINPNTLQIKLIDLSVSSLLTSELQESVITNFTDTLQYISPEQTGRLNRFVDYRTDMYSLGITFYEMLTGKLPFISEDPLELIHSHIAKLPPNIHDINPGIPNMLIALINKLLAKDPENRYAKVAHILDDLQECKKQWEEKHRIDNFVLGKNDVQDQLILSNKLYGRDEEIAKLFSTFDKVSHGDSELLLITGYSGIGKTSLVKEINKPILEKKGYFITGKFDQLQHATPYSSIITTFQNLIKKVLAEPAEKLNQIKLSLLTSLGHTGQVIIDVIPEVELIIGPQPPVPKLNPISAQNRFNYTFQKFIQGFANEEHPLVIFLDDLQWADSASLTLIETLFSDVTLHYFLLIGAYRDNEVDSTHSLFRMLKRLKEKDISLDTITLNPLAEIDIQHLLMEVFSASEFDVVPLAKLLKQKTLGNPFFINEFLKTLYQDHLIYFSQGDSKWRWDIKKIEDKNMTDNVVEMLENKIQLLLSPESQESLKLASCIGHTFDLQTLAMIREQSLAKTAMQLKEALKANLLMPLGDTYKTVSFYSEAELSVALLKQKLIYRFAHDRIQQAAYALIPPEIRQQTHLKIARLLLKQQPLKENDDRLFDLLSHLNQAKEIITDTNEKFQLAIYNLWAGKKAKRSTAYQLALSHFFIGTSLLDDASWNDQYELTFELYQNLIECLYLVGNFEEAEQYFLTTLKQTRTNLDAVQIYFIKISAYASLDQYQKVIQVGREALALLQFNLPKKISGFTLFFEIVKIHYQLGFSSIATSENKFKPANDPKIIMIINLLSKISSSALLGGDENLLAYILFKIINIGIKHGCTPETVPPLFIYANILIEKFGAYSLAQQFVELTTKLESKFYSIDIAGKNQLVIGYYIDPWFHHAKNSTKYYLKGFDLCTDAGDLEYAAHDMCAMNVLQFHLGKNLTDVGKDMENSLIILKRFKNETWAYLLKLYLLIIKNLQMNINSDHSEFEKLINGVWKENSTLLGVSSYSRLGQFFFILKQYEEALKWTTLFYKNLKFVKGGLSLSAGLLFYFLSVSHFYNKVNNKEQKIYWKQFVKIQKQFKKWAQHCPSNFEFMYLLISAEMQCLTNKPLEAAKFYDQAIHSIEQGTGYIQYIAIVNECAARCFLGLNRKPWAQSYIQNAYYAYQRWGADYKCQLLLEEFPEWLSEEKKFGTQPIDTITIMKSSQAISSELKIEILLEKLLQIAVENAGAQKGALLFEKQNHLMVVAESDDQQRIVAHPEGIPIAEVSDLPKTVVTYVQRTQENLLIDDAASDEKFSNDPYILLHKPKSILCVPILHQKRVSGYVYLENRITPNAFTPERLNILRLLSGQAAISLEIAKLYKATDRFVPREFLTQIKRPNLVELELGDQIQLELTVLFCDIRKFTTLSEQLTPSEIFKFINQFLNTMEPAIKKHHGFIDKFIGDAIMALFNEPSDAVKAGMEMLDSLELFNQQRIKINASPIKIGIGINTGELMLGIIGNQNRIEGTVIGDSVNIASRIEELTKEYPEKLLISDATKTRLPPGLFKVDKVGEINIRGKSQPILVWGVKK